MYVFHSNMIVQAVLVLTEMYVFHSNMIVQAVILLAVCATGKTLKVELVVWGTTVVAVDVTGTGGTPHQIDLQSAGPAGCNKTNWNHDRVVNVPHDKTESVRNLTSFTHYRFLYNGKLVLEGKTKADPEVSPEPVKDLKVSGSSASEITLSWQSYNCSGLAGPFQRFWMYRNAVEVGNSPDLRTTSFSYHNLSSLTTYKLRVDIDTEVQPPASTSVTTCTDAEVNTGVTTLTQAPGLRPQQAVMTWTQPELFSSATHRLKVSCSSIDRPVTVTNSTALTISDLEHSSVYECVAVIQDTDNVQCGKNGSFEVKTKLVIDVNMEVTREDSITFEFSGNYDQSFIRKEACNQTQSPDVAQWERVSSPHVENINNHATVCFLFQKTRGSEKAYKFINERLTAQTTTTTTTTTTGTTKKPGKDYTVPLVIIVVTLVILAVVVAYVVRARINSDSSSSSSDEDTRVTYRSTKDSATTSQHAGTSSV